MNIIVEENSLNDVTSDVLVVSIFEDEEKLSSVVEKLDITLDSLISNYAIKKDKFKAKFGKTYLIHANGKIKSDKVLIVGLGKKDDFTLNKLREISSKIIQKCSTIENCKNVSTILHGVDTKRFMVHDAAQMITEGALIGNYIFDKYKSKKKEIKIAELKLLNVNENEQKDAINGIALGKIFAEATNMARDLVNEPAGYATPTKLSEVALSIKGVKTVVLDKKECEDLGMNAFLAVASGSAQPPKFIHIKYSSENSGKPKKKIALIGKGITFDSGGLDLKPASAMLNMKDDMAGAACTLAVMSTVAQLQPDIEVHGIIATCENMPSSKAYKPGDVLKTKNGKTIEVDNTDAEGRLTLADAMCYAQTLEVDEIIDIATLTGACLVALGHLASGVFGNNEDMIKQLISAADKAGERFWQLPIYDEHNESLKSEIADMRNTGSRYGGASVAAAFLRNFVNKEKWVHIDIAGTAFMEKPLLEFTKGATGAGVRALLNYILN